MICYFRWTLSNWRYVINSLIMQKSLLMIYNLLLNLFNWWTRMNYSLLRRTLYNFLGRIKTNYLILRFFKRRIRGYDSFFRWCWIYNLLGLYLLYLLLLYRNMSVLSYMNRTLLNLLILTLLSYLLLHYYFLRRYRKYPFLRTILLIYIHYLFIKFIFFDFSVF